MMECVRLRMMYNHMPMSIEECLYTMFLYKAREINSVFSFTEPDIKKNIKSNNILTHVTGCGYDAIIDSISAINTSLIGCSHGIKYRKGIICNTNVEDLVVKSIHENSEEDFIWNLYDILLPIQGQRISLGECDL